MNSAEIGSNSEKLVALLDGEMSKGELGDVYYELASNPDLQNEFHELIDMKNLIRSNQAAPPIALHQQILATTGLAKPAPKGIFVGAMSFLGSKASMIVLSALFGAVFMYFMLDNGSGLVKNNQLFTSNDNYERQLVEMYLPNGIDRSIPIVTNDEISYQSNVIPFVADQLETTESVADENDLSSHDLSSYFVNAAQKFSIEYRAPLSSYTSNEFSSIPVVFNNYQAPKNDIEQKFTFAIRNFILNSYPDLDVPALNNPVLNNLGFSLMFNIDDNMAIGLELGQENFLQRYDGIVNGTHIEFKQNFLAFWGGVVFKYTMDPLPDFAGLKPYGKVLLGSTNVGALAKTEFGLGYDLSDSILAFIGFDGTTLMYDFRSNVFFTHKYGLTYGLSLKF